MSDNQEKIKLNVTPKTSEKVAAAAVASATQFASKINSETLITSLQRDLLKAHDFAMRQEANTTFVVTDFTLQMKAVVTQEGNKAIFALPTKPAELDPNQMSVVNISLKPIPIEAAQKAGTSVRPVEAIEGIGTALGARLRDQGINTVSDLALASPETVAKIGVSNKKATEFVSMAKLMVKSEIAGVEGVDEQVAELLVVGAKIDSKEKLAQANPEELAKAINEAIKSKTVKVPQSLRPTIEDSQRWVASAKTILERK